MTGCEIDNQPDEQTVWFVKHDPADPAKRGSAMMLHRVD
jgi:hypothetical protein